ncbi:hypothetical protein SASPL_104942 [Salvia splendens]|uniref:Uncharacterized protein n=1 Tax=Salvia splendens TaxID=180675 RepID=A0A8X9A9J2_SALSN|nr:hypothetical protein SASPL_104942 [Salvia splendens]
MMLEVARRLEVTYHLAKGEAESSMVDFKEDILEGRDVENFSLDKLHAATEGFSNKIISEDSFNVIYKGCSEAAGENRCSLHKIRPRQTSKDGGCCDDVRISLGCGSEFRRAVRHQKN